MTTGRLLLLLDWLLLVCYCFLIDHYYSFTHTWLTTVSLLLIPYWLLLICYRTIPLLTTVNMLPYYLTTISLLLIFDWLLVVWFYSLIDYRYCTVSLSLLLDWILLVCYYCLIDYCKYSLIDLITTLWLQWSSFWRISPGWAGRCSSTTETASVSWISPHSPYLNKEQRSVITSLWEITS
jgi:hypothetical protein